MPLHRRSMRVSPASLPVLSRLSPLHAARGSSKRRWLSRPAAMPHLLTVSEAAHRAVFGSPLSVPGLERRSIGFLVRGGATTRPSGRSQATHAQGKGRRRKREPLPGPFRFANSGAVYMARAAHYHGSVSSHVVAGGTEILALEGEFDASNAGDFERRLSEASEPERTDILLDLRGVMLPCIPAQPFVRA